MSDDEGLFADAKGGAFPSASPGDFVDFGWADDTNKKMTGRRKKHQKKVKPGSFGEEGFWVPPPPACRRRFRLQAVSCGLQGNSVCALMAAVYSYLLYPGSLSSVILLSIADTMGLSESVLKAIRRKGYRLPTPIQRKTLPLSLQVGG